MTILSNASLAMTNTSYVFSTQSNYTSMEIWYGVLFLFATFMITSLVIDGNKYPFEKLMASSLAFVLSFSNLLASFSLAIINTIDGGFMQYSIAGNTIQLNAVVPSIVMQTTVTWQIVSLVILVVCLINLINSIIVLYDVARSSGRSTS